MAEFITRVELHHATEDNYRDLHSYMEEEKFCRTIVGKDGTVYHLPPAEYYSKGNLTAMDVRSLAENAAARTGKTAAIFTTESLSWAWVNLQKV